MIQLTLEVAVLYIVLRPQSYNASWARALIGFLLFAAWVVLGAAITMHTGRVYDYHWVWTLLVTLGLFGTLILSASVAAGITKRLPNER